MSAGKESGLGVNQPTWTRQGSVAVFDCLIRWGFILLLYLVNVCFVLLGPHVSTHVYLCLFECEQYASVVLSSSLGLCHNKRCTVYSVSGLDCREHYLCFTRSGSRIDQYSSHFTQKKNLSTFSHTYDFLSSGNTKPELLDKYSGHFFARFKMAKRTIKVLTAYTLLFNIFYI